MAWGCQLMTPQSFTGNNNIPNLYALNFRICWGVSN